MMEKEYWKDAAGYEGLYEISSLGRLRSCDRVTTGKNGTARKLKGKIMKTPLTVSGYPHTALVKDGKKKTHTVHRLMALTYLPNPECKRTVNHIDGVKTNNLLSNLEWATDKENSKHAWDMGLSKPINPNKNGNRQGENLSYSVLTESDVVFIRKNCKKNGGNVRIVEMCEMFGVTSATISSVIDETNWKHIRVETKKVENYTLSKTGYKYVFANGNRFQGQFSYNKKKYRCGSFGTPREAYEAVMERRKELGLT